MNSYGSLFRITTFGESHGVGIGVVVDGCPAGLPIDLDFIQSELARRRPGQSHITTPRNEEDRCEILSGVFEGVSTGAPIALLIANKDPRSHDYAHMAQAFRPSHADYTYEQKYGLRDHRGGGRSSARETAARVAAGAIAKLMLNREGIKPIAYVSKVGNIAAPPHEMLDLSLCETNPVRCPDAETAAEMIQLIEMVRADGDTIGGVVTGIIQGVPSGLGEPVFDKLHAELGKAMLSINAVKGFEYGSGFKGAAMRGSTQNDPFYIESGKVRTRTNHSGGIQGGISNGETIYFNIAFKPVSTLGKTQQTVDRAGNEVLLTDKGRHDACVVPRAVPIVEAMAALVMANYTLLRKAYTA